VKSEFTKVTGMGVGSKRTFPPRIFLPTPLVARTTINMFPKSVQLKTSTSFGAMPLTLYKILRIKTLGIATIFGLLV